MVIGVGLGCPVKDCDFVAKKKNGVTLHVQARHKSIPAGKLDQRDGQVAVNLERFGGKLPDPVVGGFWKSLFSTTSLAITIFWILIITSQGLANPLNLVSLIIAYPFVLFGGWWLDQKMALIQVACIRNPDDDDGQVRVDIEWWPKSKARLLPKESKHNKFNMYVIDVRGDKPIVFTPFSVESPEYAIPIRGAMVNQQTDNEQLNRVHYKGVSPETVTQAFFLGAIAILALANYAVFSQLMEYVNA